MNAPTTIAALGPALAALADITAAFPHLPAACFDIGVVFPERLNISLHDSLDHFEVWRTALGIPTDAVEYGILPTNMDLTAYGSFGGAQIKLSGFAPLLPAPAPASATVGGAS